MTLETLLQQAEEQEALKPVGINQDPNSYDEAIIGITQEGNLVYSIEKMIEICKTAYAQEEGMTEEAVNETANEAANKAAVEWLEYNTFNTYAGEKTPLFIYERDSQ